MAKRSRLAIAILPAVLLALLGFVVYAYLGSTRFPGGRVDLVNGSGTIVSRVSFTAVSGDERHEFETPELAPGASWRAQFDGSPMPTIRLSWRENGVEYVHEGHTDLWASDVWRVEILSGGRVRTGCWRDRWITEDVHEGLANETTERPIR